MNNKRQTDAIWHHIRSNSPRRTRHSFTNWRTVVWITLLALIGFCIWQGTQWWRLNIEISDTIHSINPIIDQQLESLLEEVNAQKSRLAFLEEQALRNQDLIAWMTVQAEASKTEMIGVEHLRERQVEQYIYSPVKFTLRGDYHSFGRLINLLEHSQYPIKLDYLFIATRRSSPNELIMDIVLCKVSGIYKMLDRWIHL